MTSQQRKHLEARMRVAKATLFQRLNGGVRRYDSCQPAHVRAAERIIEKWRREQRHAEAVADRIVERRTAKVTEAMLFGDPAKALDAVKKFEHAAKRA